MYFFVVERGYLLSKHNNGDLSVRLEDHMFFPQVRKIMFSPGSSSGISLGLL